MRRLLLFFVLAAGAVRAQPIFSQPDCFIQVFQSAAVGVSGSFDNRGVGCVDWTVVYTSQGFAAVSLEFDSAPDSNGTPGAFVAFAGTIVSGSNPNTTLNQSLMQFNGYFPWLRLNFVSKTGTGTLTAMAFGFRPIAFNTFKTNNITQIGGNNVFACTGSGQANQALFNLSSSGNQQVIPLSGTNRILICHIDLSMASSVDLKLTQGTGSNCAASTADVTGLYKNVVTFSQDYGPFAPLVIASGDAACINLSANVVGGGVVIFTYQP